MVECASKLTISPIETTQRSFSAWTSDYGRVLPTNSFNYLTKNLAIVPSYSFYRCTPLVSLYVEQCNIVAIQPWKTSDLLFHCYNSFIFSSARDSLKIFGQYNMTYIILKILKYLIHHIIPFDVFLRSWTVSLQSFSRRFSFLGKLNSGKIYPCTYAARLILNRSSLTHYSQFPHCKFNILALTTWIRRSSSPPSTKQASVLKKTSHQSLSDHFPVPQIIFKPTSSRDLFQVFSFCPF